MKKLVVDLDGTLTIDTPGAYADKEPNDMVISKLREYQDQGFQITISTARNMRTHESKVGKINIYTLPTILAWLDKHQVPYDEVLVGKPWCGFDGFYIDDKAIRPSEFVRLDKTEIDRLLQAEQQYFREGL